VYSSKLLVLYMVAVNIDDDAIFGFICVKHKMNLKKGQPIWLPKSFFVGRD
jgi:hypothetical protein